MFVRSTSCGKILQRLFINSKIAHRRAVFGRHIGNRRTVSHGKPGSPFTVEFNKFPDNLGFAKYFRYAKHQIGGSRALRQSA